MQIATACCLHRASTFGKSQKYSRNVALLLIGGITLETLYHSYMNEHVVHELTFLFLILLVIGRTRSLISKRVEKAEDKQNLRRLAVFGAGMSSSFLHDRIVTNTDIRAQFAFFSATFSGSWTSSIVPNSPRGSAPLECLGVLCWSSMAGGTFLPRSAPTSSWLWLTA
jgi:hypothetical protein